MRAVDKRRNRQELVFVTSTFFALPSAISFLSQIDLVEESLLKGSILEIIEAYRETILKFGESFEKFFSIDFTLPWEPIFFALSATLMLIANVIVGRYFIDFERRKNTEDPGVYDSIGILAVLLGVIRLNGDEFVGALFGFFFVLATFLGFRSNFRIARQAEGLTRSFIAFCLMLFFSVVFVLAFLFVLLRVWNHNYSTEDFWQLLPFYSFLVFLIVQKINMRAVPSVVFAVLGMIILDRVPMYLSVV